MGTVCLPWGTFDSITEEFFIKLLGVLEKEGFTMEESSSEGYYSNGRGGEYMRFYLEIYRDEQKICELECFHYIDDTGESYSLSAYSNKEVWRKLINEDLKEKIMEIIKERREKGDRILLLI